MAILGLAILVPLLGTGLAFNYSSFASQVTSLQSQVSQLNTDIQNLRIQGVANSDTISSLRNQVSQLQSDKSALQNQIQQLQGQLSQLGQPKIDGRIIYSNCDASYLGTTAGCNNLCITTDCRWFITGYYANLGGSTAYGVTLHAKLFGQGGVVLVNDCSINVGTVQGQTFGDQVQRSCGGGTENIAYSESTFTWRDQLCTGISC